MSPEQFEIALERTRLSDASAHAARLVLVEGTSQAGAASQVGIKHRQQVSRAVNRLRQAATADGVCVVCGGKVERPEERAQ